MQKSNTYLKRGKGKHIANIAKRHFYPYYKANTQHLEEFVVSEEVVVLFVVFFFVVFFFLGYMINS